MLLIEHVMQAVMNLADEVYVLNNGRLIARGAPHAIANDPQVIEAYLGHGTAERLRRKRSMLEVRNLRGGYGAVEVLRGVSLEIRAGEIVAVLGSNGAGKSTLNNTLCGLLPAFGGERCVRRRRRDPRARPRRSSPPA